MSLANKVAIVSAAGRGIGRAIAIELARAGANVVVNSYGEDTTASTSTACSDIGGEALAFAGDITRPGVMLACVDAAIEKFGHVDILVNNVGAAPKTAGELQEGPLGPAAMLWDAMYEQNLKPAVLMSEAVIPHFKAQRAGKIVNISSIAGVAAFSPDFSASFAPPAYGAMKAAMISYTQNLAESLGPFGVNVNAVCPGIVWTDAWRGNAENAVAHIERFQGQDPREWFEGIARGDYPEIFDRTPLLREQTVADIGNAVVFLVSDNAVNITGQSILVDGGMVKN